jgi:2-polyprenyl-3-methyl-5-hydroxy-6-metoxy-1,4-benzoquinol methylase
MTKDIVQHNLASYVGERAVKEWTAERSLFDVEAELIARYFPPPPARILDLGCGGGRTTASLEELGYHVEAIDLSSDLVAEARKRVQRSRVQVMDARSLEFEAGSFDAVLFSFNGMDCVHPARERQRVLHEIQRVLRPEGILYYSGHNAIGAWFPRPGDSAARFLKRNGRMLQAQRTEFSERDRYLAYPTNNGTEILYSGLPHIHRKDLDAAGFTLLAVHGSRSYRKGPHILDEAPKSAVGALTHAGRLVLTCPHLHYIAIRRAR